MVGLDHHGNVGEKLNTPVVRPNRKLYCAFCYTYLRPYGFTKFRVVTMEGLLYMASYAPFVRGGGPSILKNF